MYIKNVCTCGVIYCPVSSTVWSFLSMAAFGAVRSARPLSWRMARRLCRPCGPSVDGEGAFGYTNATAHCYPAYTHTSHDQQRRQTSVLRAADPAETRKRRARARTALLRRATSPAEQYGNLRGTAPTEHPATAAAPPAGRAPPNPVPRAAALATLREPGKNSLARRGAARRGAAVGGGVPAPAPARGLE